MDGDYEQELQEELMDELRAVKIQQLLAGETEEQSDEADEMALGESRLFATH